MSWFFTKLNLKSNKLWTVLFGGGSFTGVGLATYTVVERDRRMRHRYREGVLDGLAQEQSSELVYLRRPALEEKLKRALGEKCTGRYYVIRGEVGSGKSAVLQEVVRQLIRENAHSEGKKGAPVYIKVSEGLGVTDTLARAVDFRFDEHIDFMYVVKRLAGMQAKLGKSNESKLTRLLNAIEKSSFAYKREFGRPTVIVIDGADLLQHNVPGSIRALQVKAKLWADSNICKLVLVFHGESGVEQLKEDSSLWSRAVSDIVVPDLTETETRHFLGECGEGGTTRGSHFSDKDKDMIYNSVGGRLFYLKMIQTDCCLGMTVQESLDSLQRKERQKLARANLYSDKFKVLKLLLSHQGSVLLQDVVSAGAPLPVVRDMAVHDMVRYEEKSDGVWVCFHSKLTETVSRELFPRTP